ncbi:type II toxin-antitoxin system PemK/MazF family toxin [Microbacterium sp. NPDC057659]|uniref:type II toxin-antitoxin system PemK/MazF family toxin n=1 Tax=Microbacterium sp. NPDC057659 TaxID=3346198 RepID=UPI00366F98E6
MSSTNGILSTLLDILQKILRKEATVSPVAPRRPDHSGMAEEAGRMPGSETIRVDPDRIRDLRVSYAPQRDGAPDAGEVIWTWVPYEENDGRGKDRPVLVIGRHSTDRVYAVRMTSKPHDGDRDYLSIGSGGWDGQGRQSWVDIEQLYSVHDRGMRREAAVLDRERYKHVVAALMRRYGWARES